MYCIVKIVHVYSYICQNNMHIAKQGLKNFLNVL